jgi:hypothetical protein
MNRRSFVLCTASGSLMPSFARAADSVTGRFAAQRKETKLVFISAHVRDGASGKEAVVIVATERDHSASKNPAHDAEFSKFGSGVTISLYKPDGAVFEVQLVHADFPQSPVTVVGTIKGVDVKFVDDRVEGRFASNGAKSMFEGNPYETVFDVDLQVSAQIRPKAA